MKIRIIVLSVVISTVLLSTQCAWGDNSVNVYLDGIKKEYNGYILNGHGMIPIFEVLDDMGVAVYESTSASFTGALQKGEFRASYGSKTVFVDGVPNTLDEAPVVRNNVAFSSVQLLKKVAPGFVAWDEKSRSLLIYSTNYKDFDLARAIRSNKLVEEIHQKVSFTDMTKNQLDEAIKQLEEAIRLDSHNKRALLYAFEAYGVASEHGKEDEVLLKLATLFPYDYTIYMKMFAYTNRYMTSTEIDRFVKQAEEWIPDEYERGAVLIDAGSRCLNSGLTEMAYQYYKKASSVQGREHQTFYNAGYCAYLLGYYDEALSYFNQAPDAFFESEIGIKKVQTLLRMGRDKEAYRLLESVSNMGGDVDCFNGDEAFRAGKMEEALRHYEKALELGKRSAVCGKAMTLMKLKRYDEAQEAINLYIREYPNDYYGYYLKGVAYKLSGNRWVARIAAEKAYSMAQEDEDVATLYKSLL